MAVSSAFYRVFSKITSLIVASFFMFGNFAYSVPEDPAPISEEMYKLIVKNHFKGSTNPDVQALLHVVQSTVSLIKTFKSQLNNNVSLSTAELSMLEGKQLEIESVKLNVWNNFAKGRYQLSGLGLAKSRTEWDSKQKKVEKHFNALQSAIESIKQAKNLKQQKRAVKYAEGLLEMLRMPSQKKVVPDDRPFPTLGPVSPTLVKPSKEKVSAPQYTVSLPVKPLMYAMLDGVILTDVSPPVTPVEAASCSYQPSDLAETIDVKLTAEIQALAKELNYSPAKIFEYVSNNIKFYPYHGSLKGSQATLISGEANSTDHASLLIALLRASKIPARYVTGLVKAGNPRINNWFGMKDTTSTLEYLRLAGIPTETSPITGFQHVWVEACIPYGNYRGTGVEKYGFRWIPLDASFKQYKYSDGIAVNVTFDHDNYLSVRTDELPVEHYEGIVENAVKLIDPNNSLQDVYETTDQTNTKYDILPSSLPYQIGRFIPWVPGGSAEVSALPDTHRYKYDLSIMNSSNNLLAPTLTMNISEVALNRVTLSYKPVSSSDQALYDAWSGNYDDLPAAYRYDYVLVQQAFRDATGFSIVVDASNVENVVQGLNSSYGYNITPTVPISGSAVNVLPVFKVEGVERQVGTSSITLGEGTKIIMKVRRPDFYSSPSCPGDITGTDPDPTCIIKRVFTGSKAGAIVALTPDAMQQSDEYLQTRSKILLNNVNSGVADKERTLGEFLNIALNKYKRYRRDGVREIGNLNGLKTILTPSVSSTSSGVNVQTLFDLPFGLFPNGLQIDDTVNSARVYTSQPEVIDLRGEPRSFRNDDKLWEVRRLSILVGSAFEHYIWQENAHIDAVSTVRGLQYANEINIPVLTLDSTNIASFDSLMNASMASYKTSITNLIAEGATVRVPQSTFSYTAPNSVASWNGAVWLGENRTTGTMSAIISGGLNGGYGITGSINNSTDALAITSENSSYESDVPSDTYRFKFTAEQAISTGGDFGIDSTFYSDSATDAYSQYESGQISSAELNSRLEQIAAQQLTSFNSGPLNWGVNSNVNLTGDPVNVATGNMVHAETDIEIKGRGMPIVFERFYNSSKPKDGPLGYGWTHSLNHQLVFLDNDYNSVNDAADNDGITSVAAWVDGTGGVKTFGVNADATGVAINTQMTNPSGYYLQATRNTDGTYSLMEKNGLTYTFESVAGTLGQTAKLLSISDRNNNTLTMNYTGQNLTSVTDDLNRSLTFTYTPENRISEIQDWTGRTFQYTYDANGDLIEYKNPLAVAGQQTPTTYSYYNGLPLSHAMQNYTKPNGNSMTFEYYSNRKTFRHYNELGETMTFTYNIFRGETVVINERGYSKQYFFDKNGSPTKMIDENGGLTTYTYNDPNNIYNTSEKRDALGYKTQYEYDADGNLIKLTNPSGSTVEYSYFNQFSQAQKVKDANGNYVIYKFDGQGNRTESISLKKGIGSNIDPTLYTPIANDIIAWTISTYDNYGNPLTVTRVRDFNSRDGPTVAYNYNDVANGVDGVNPINQKRMGDKDGDGIIAANEFDSADLTYDALGRPLQGASNWYPTQTEYDALGRVIRRSDKYGHMRDITYDANNNVVGQKLELSGTLVDQSSAIFDSADRKTSSTDSGGFTSYYRYDEVGNIIETTNPDNYSIGFEYDGNNNVIKAYDEEGNTVTRTVDLTGKIRTETDPNGNTITNEYYGPEQEGRLYRQYDALGRYTEFDYDANGNVIRVTDNLGRSTLTQYDALNRPIRIVGPVLSQLGIRQVTQYRYDNLGNRIQVIAGGTTDLTGLDSSSDLVSVQMTTQYDDFGRVIKETDPLGRSWTKQYDQYGNVIQTTDAKGQATTFTYNYGGQLATRTDHNSNITRITYNPLGQPLTISSDNVTYTYRYDSAHRQISMVDSRGSKQIDYDYSPGGLLNYKIDNEGNQTDYLYDPVGRLSGIWAPNGDLVTYVYDAGGRLTEKWLTNGVDTQYTYNADNTLASVQNIVNSLEISRHDYSYDGIGQRQNLTETINNTTKRYKYLYDELNRLTEVQDSGTATPIETYGYDIYNNRESRTTQAGTEVYLHDAAQQLTEIRQNNTTGSIIASFNYDANGNMNIKTEAGITTLLSYDVLNRVSQVSQSGKPTQTYRYDQGNRRLQKTVGTTTTNYLYEDNNIVGEYGSDWTLANAIYTHGAGSDVPISRDVDGLAEYYQQDGINSVVAMTDMVGNVSGSASYDAFGNILEKTGSVPLYGYTGREPDETGLIYYRARYYDPRIGRFTQADPAGFIDGINRYTYAVNNPVNFRDPSGYSKTDPAGTGDLFAGLSYWGGVGLNSSSLYSAQNFSILSYTASRSINNFSNFISSSNVNAQCAVASCHDVDITGRTLTNERQNAALANASFSTIGTIFASIGCAGLLTCGLATAFALDTSRNFARVHGPDPLLAIGTTLHLSDQQSERLASATDYVVAGFSILNAYKGVARLSMELSTPERFRSASTLTASGVGLASTTFDLFSSANTIQQLKKSIHEN